MAGAHVTFVKREDGPARNKVMAGSWGWRFLKNKKVVNGILYQLHATRGWKKIGKAEEKK